MEARMRVSFEATRFGPQHLIEAYALRAGSFDPVDDAAHYDSL
jgi:hypothetical protein